MACHFSGQRFRWVWVMGLLGLLGCSSCGKKADSEVVSSHPFTEIAPGNLESSWRWEKTSVRNYAVPAGCRLLSVPHIHHRDTSDLYYFAAENDTSTLAVASGERDVDAVTQSRGLITLGLDAPGRVRDVPWVHLWEPPVMASSGQGWIGLLSESNAFDSKIRLGLWREGGKVDVLGEGDSLRAVDAHCVGGRCAVLTTRVGAVATAGATLWKGDLSQPVSSWSRDEIKAEQVSEGAVPIKIMEWDGDRALVAFDGPRHVEFWRFKEGKAEDEGKVMRTGLLLDVVATRDAKVAIMALGEPDPHGCVSGGAGIEIAVEGRASVVLPTPMRPASGYARKLGEGAFVTWGAASNCIVSDRKVVYGLVLGPDGVPLSSVMAMAHADGHAVATRGEEVHVWLSVPKSVVWIRAACAMAGDRR